MISTVEPFVGRKDDTAKSIACDMENDLATIRDLANAILFSAVELDLEDEIRMSIERLTRIILEKAMILEKQRRRAAGQDHDDYRPGFCKARQGLFRIPGKHRNCDTAWDALQDIMATRH